MQSSSLRGRFNTILSNQRQLSTNPQEFILRKERWRGIASSSLWNTEHALTEQSKSHDPCVVPHQFWLKKGEKIDQSDLIQQRLITALLIINLLILLMSFNLFNIKILIYHICIPYLNRKYKDFYVYMSQTIQDFSQYFCCCNTLF